MGKRKRILLAIDVGNSTSKFGIVEAPPGMPSRIWRVTTHADRTPDEWRVFLAPLFDQDELAPDRPVDVVISSVVPNVTHALVDLFGAWLGAEPLTIDASRTLGIGIEVDHPQEVGADRLANAAAGHHLVGPPVIVVDAGTATKFDVVNAAGDFIGGVIAPGIGIGRDALARKGARLHAVEIAKPAHVIGRNTTEAMQSGLLYGHATMIDGMLRHVQSELDTDAPVIATGGFGPLLASISPVFSRVEPLLTLYGASLIWTRHCRSNGEHVPKQA